MIADRISLDLKLLPCLKIMDCGDNGSSKSSIIGEASEMESTACCNPDSKWVLLLVGTERAPSRSYLEKKPSPVWTEHRDKSRALAIHSIAENNTHTDRKHTAQWTMPQVGDPVL